jgi:hypothetical protein
VNVGVPGGHQRQAELMRQQRTQHPDVAGAGDMDQLGAEFLEMRGHQMAVAHEQQVE